jgi:hypothetical protein
MPVRRALKAKKRGTKMSNARLIKKGTAVSAKKEGGLKRRKSAPQQGRDDGVAGGVAKWLDDRQKNRQDPRKAFASLFSTVEPSLAS